uniref:Uncharacterized protein n=1 Tax=Nyssomyia neivai TaxID=330878 RepID=A0A1L8D7T7_9DIPT
MVYKFIKYFVRCLSQWGKKKQEQINGRKVHKCKIYLKDGVSMKSYLLKKKIIMFYLKNCIMQDVMF